MSRQTLNDITVGYTDFDIDFGIDAGRMLDCIASVGFENNAGVFPAFFVYMRGGC